MQILTTAPQQQQSWDASQHQAFVNGNLGSLTDSQGNPLGATNVATQVTTGVNPLGPLLSALLATGEYVDMGLLSDTGIEATRNCQTRSSLDSAISALPQPADFNEWVEA